MFLYYRFLSTYSRDARDLDDLFDGIRNMKAENDINSLMYERNK